MKKSFLIALIVPVLGTVAGCSYMAVNTSSLANRPDVRLINPSGGPYSIEATLRDDGTRDYSWEINSRIEQAAPCRVKYHKLYSTSRFMVVEGRIGDTGKDYPVVLDTGASQSIFIKDTHVLDNKLAIYPMRTGKGGLNGFDLGLCHLPELHLGNAVLVNWPCFYLERHAKPELFGLSIAHDNIKDNCIIVGLQTLRAFKYIMFDNINKEVEISYSESFEPEKQGLWEKYPLSIKEDVHGNAFLFVGITIAGVKTNLQLDTGNGRGLAVRKEQWEKICGKIQPVNLRNGKDLYPYIGRLSCQRGTIPALETGNRAVRNAEISVFANESPLLENCQGLLGMQFFEDTVMVLDFENKLMWINYLQK